MLLEGSNGIINDGLWQIWGFKWHHRRWTVAILQTDGIGVVINKGFEKSW